MDAATRYHDDVLETSDLSYEAFRESLHLVYGRCHPGGVEPRAFTGWIRAGSLFGFGTADVASNARTIRRSYQDVRLDGADYYVVGFHAGGKTKLFDNNGQAVRVVLGNVVLLDAARPFTCDAEETGDLHKLISIGLPRKELVSHLGFDPQGGLCRSGATPAARLLLDLIQSSGRNEGAGFSRGDSYMQLVIYDLVGALFVPSEPEPASRRTDKLFTRISGVIRDSFTDPTFGPAQAAAKAGISLRYLHKLFLERSLTCQEFIYSRRLDHAAQLLRRRASRNSDQPLSDIAYACGFNDYAHFSRKFRQRYGQPPGGYSPEDGEINRH
jgi:AraC family transcriptional regulator, positive regulator of tynA and feaB